MLFFEGFFSGLFLTIDCVRILHSMKIARARAETVGDYLSCNVLLVELNKFRTQVGSYATQIRSILESSTKALAVTSCGDG